MDDNTDSTDDSTDGNLISENGRHINLTKDWTKVLFQRINYLKKRTTAEVFVDNFYRFF